MLARKRLRDSAKEILGSVRVNGASVPIVDEEQGAVDSITIPCLTITIDEDNAVGEEGTTLKNSILIDATLSITALAKDDATVDDILEETRKLVRNSGDFNGAATNGYDYSGFTLERQEEGDASIFAGTHEYICRYRADV